jgi:hypothetical protein
VVKREGWKDKGPNDFLPGVPVPFDITITPEWYYLDCGTAYAAFPRTPARWKDMCELLKGRVP